MGLKTWLDTQLHTEHPILNTSHNLYVIFLPRTCSKCLRINMYCMKVSISSLLPSWPDPGRGHVESLDPVAWDWLYWAAWWLAWIPNDTGSWSLQSRWHWTALCIVRQLAGMQIPGAAVFTIIPPLRRTHLCRNMRSGLELALGTLILFFHSLP